LSSLRQVLYKLKGLEWYLIYKCNQVYNCVISSWYESIKYIFFGESGESNKSNESDDLNYCFIFGESGEFTKIKISM